jgi:DnaJ-class molecular chaperone
MIMGTKKEKLHRSFNPEKYKMMLCPGCRGTGKSSDGDKGVEVCSHCAGFGWIKKGDDHK